MKTYVFLLFFFFNFSPDKDTEMYVDNRTSTFEFCWSFFGKEARSLNALAQNERLFFAQIVDKSVYIQCDRREFKKPWIRFFFVKPRAFKIAEVTMSHKWSSGWIRMIPVHHPDQELNIFTARDKEMGNGMEKPADDSCLYFHPVTHLEPSPPSAIWDISPNHPFSIVANLALLSEVQSPSTSLTKRNRLFASTDFAVSNDSN